MASKQIRPIRVEGNVAYVPLTRGYEAIIDAADVPLVAGFNWHVCVHASGNTYALCGVWHAGKSVSYAMHRVLMGAPSEVEIDHRDGDGLNNRRANLRKANSSQNKQNSRKSSANTSGYKGVNWHTAKGKWQSRIKKDRVSRHLGYFDTPEAAHAAYCRASGVLHGEFGRTA